MPHSLKPYLVADRPMTFRFLSGLNLHKRPVDLGIMTHANVSKNVMDMIANFPCIDQDYCGVVDGGCPYQKNTESELISNSKGPDCCEIIRYYRR